MLPYGEGLTDRTASTILLYTLFCIPAGLLRGLSNSEPMVETLP